MDNQVISFCELIESVIRPDKECKLQGEVDWSHMSQLAKEHNILPIFMEGAVKFPAYRERPEYEREMQESLAIVDAQVKRTNAFLKLYQAFIEEDIHPIVMKGLICRSLYGNLCDHRPSGDEDVLIPATEYWKAKHVLISNGYVCARAGETGAQLEILQEVSFIHPTEKLHVELHLNPMGRQNDARSQMSDYFKNTFENYREVEIQGIQFRTMNHQQHLLYLILHTFKHFTSGGFGVRHMLDILLYQEKYAADIDLKLLCDTLHDFKADIFWTDIIYIGNLYFGFELPILKSPNCPQELFEDVLERGTFGNGTQAEAIASRTTMLAAGNYLKNRESNLLVVIWKALFPRREYLLYYSPYLEKKPWLLPVAWVKRWGRFIVNSRKNVGNLATESLRISQRRMKLLKKYDLV